MKTVFLRILDSVDKMAALCAAIGEPQRAHGRERFEVDVASFAALPRSPFAYWVSGELRDLFRKFPLFETGDRMAKQGLVTADDFRFVRGWWEMPPQCVGQGWYPFAKGGNFSRFYADVYLFVNWGFDGREISSYCKSGSNRVASRPQNTDFYFRPALTWSLRTQGGLSFRAMPMGCIFGHKGPAAYIEDDADSDLLALLAVVNTKAFRALIDLQMAFGSYEVGVIQRTPIPFLAPGPKVTLAALAHRAWILKRRLDTTAEISHAFTLPALLQVEGETLVARCSRSAGSTSAAEAELATIQGEIDELCFDLYGIDEVDRCAISAGFPQGPDERSDTGVNEDQDVARETDRGIDADILAIELVSWAVGVAFGRFDVRLATGAMPLPNDPEPFDPLPVCSLASLTGDDGLPLASAPAGYPLAFPEDGILVDDFGHIRDFLAAVRGVFESVFGKLADGIWQETATLLDPKNHDIQEWLASSFFSQHLQFYSKGRRKAPVYWQLGVPSGRYSIWLYAHRLTPDSFFQIQSDIAEPKLRYEERQLTNLVQESGANPSAKQRKQIAAQEAFVEELRVLLEEIRRVAPDWNPSLDDGIVLTMAPLWALVPHKAWQRGLKSKWEELEAGKYDWAHIAMDRWPARVTAKCKTDKSLAIAHGLDR